jgi:drug/metabolite transporter (DMT)-like permease
MFLKKFTLTLLFPRKNMIIDFAKIAKRYPTKFGVLLAFSGVLILTPDTLVIRLSGLERWSLMGWRGILMGTMLLVIWRLFLTKNASQEWRSLSSLPGLIVIAAFSINSATFTLGIVETSATVVLTAVATMPVFAAILSFLLLGERQGFLGWGAIIAAMLGVAVVVVDGSNATGSPSGSVVLGAFFGVLTAIGLALTFTIARKYPSLGVLPASALGAMISGVAGLGIAGSVTIGDAPLWTVLSMGLIILPLSFTCLNLAPRYTSSAIVSLLMLLEMVVGPFWVWLGVGEHPSLKMILGAAFVTLVLGLHIIRTQWFGRDN